MVLFEVFTVIALVGCAIEAYLILRINKELEDLKTSVNKKVETISIETRLKDVFEEDGSEDLHKLASKLFEKIKSRFDCKASSYSELVVEIKKSPKLQGELGELLIDFFTKINRLFYKKEGLSEEEKEDLKKETRLIIKKMQNL